MRQVEQGRNWMPDQGLNSSMQQEHLLSKHGNTWYLVPYTKQHSKTDHSSVRDQIGKTPTVLPSPLPQGINHYPTIPPLPPLYSLPASFVPEHSLREKRNMTAPFSVPADWHRMRAIPAPAALPAA
ncbi:uncharacterized protein BO95DRAFT_433086 [Aspergillus brunneoviolaceus CBS 621.78]|uniref:Uncharacterized protein n=1 Tax=Aspergillus brunneoviolaceus CBS 621.78 TaxID=1450534 RepID=A0ACD1G5P8_9EURO|nr:hypothetical protein BO95DRAFT_433086 [Aspergillus brunneoviolaceus CBS 621.78]RAH44497.1 hypothetical protein BO95DRAFT_433086 [Aspergillus brunneoviolaceus CBS 621.78]